MQGFVLILSIPAVEIILQFKRLKSIQQIFQHFKNGFPCEWFPNKIVDAFLVCFVSVNARIVSGDHHDLDKWIYFSNSSIKLIPNPSGK